MTETRTTNSVISRVRCRLDRNRAPDYADVEELHARAELAACNPLLRQCPEFNVELSPYLRVYLRVQEHVN